MILARLKRETRSQHEQMEATVDLFNRITSLEDYRELLARLWGFYAPLEQLIGRAGIASSLTFNWPVRQKEPLLRRDLLALGVNMQGMAQLPQASSLQLPQLESAAATWGCLYVLEGATLGGAVIARHLQQTFGLHAHNGAAFYNAYGPDIGPMWKAFGEALTEFAGLQPIEAEQDVVSGAAATFDGLRAWLAHSTHESREAL